MVACQGAGTAAYRAAVVGRCPNGLLASREVCPLADAERQTRTYSNRFAAYIVKRHQFDALCALALPCVQHKTLPSVMPSERRATHTSRPLRSEASRPQESLPASKRAGQQARVNATGMPRYARTDRSESRAVHSA